MANKFIQSIEEQLQDIARKKYVLSEQLQGLDYQQKHLEEQKSEILTQFFYQNRDHTFIQKVSETHFIEKNANLDVVAQIFAIFQNGEYIWEYSIRNSDKLHPLKSTKFNHTEEIVALFAIIDKHIENSLKLFHLFEDSAKNGLDLNPNEVEHLLSVFRNR